MEQKRTPEEQFAFMVMRVVELMQQRIREEVPESGSFVSPSVSFEIPEAKLMGMLMVEPSMNGTPQERRLLMGVYPRGGPYNCTSYLTVGTCEALIAYLDKADQNELIQKFKTLCERLSDEK